MFEGLFQPLHLLLFFYAMGLGIPFPAGFFLGRYVELKKLKKS
jgi:cytochrome c biogenesis protein CcdA